MGLSIIIPTYHFDCTHLVSSLNHLCQASEVKEQYEITVIDDGSKDMSVNTKNQVINEWEHCKFVQQPQNTGKSTLLNKAILQAVYPLILLIDCDAQVCTDNFIEKYLNAAPLADVICGSLITSPESLREDNHLRYKYETAAKKIRSIDYLSKYPYQHFTTFNVLFHKEVFQKVQFDEDLSEYGYEDTILGLKLKQHAISTLHIDAPLIHTGIDSTALFLDKTEKALRNLKGLSLDVQNSITVSQVANKLKACHLSGLVILFYKLFNKSIRKQLLGSTPNLFLFNLYKLGFFLSLKQ